MVEPQHRARIARHFLPNRYHYYYSRSKLGSDPLYAGVAEALGGSTAPLLDLGCGLGLLAHTLTAAGVTVPYRGVDNDAEKIESARAAAQRAGLHHARFDVTDLGQGFPDGHRGSVAVLDMLQYLGEQEQMALLGKAAACLEPGARLVIRTGLADTGWRSRLTRTADVFARLARWMNAAPKRYPTRAGLESLLAGFGLDVHCRPLWGRTPFNNWLVVASPSSGNTVS